MMTCGSSVMNALSLAAVSSGLVRPLLVPINDSTAFRHVGGDARCRCPPDTPWQSGDSAPAGVRIILGFDDLPGIVGIGGAEDWCVVPVLVSHAVVGSPTGISTADETVTWFS